MAAGRRHLLAVRSGRGSQSGPHDTRPTSVCLEDWKSESASGETAATIPKFPCVGLELCAVVTSGQQQQGQRLRSDRAQVSSAVLCTRGRYIRHLCGLLRALK